MSAFSRNVTLLSLSFGSKSARADLAILFRSLRAGDVGGRVLAGGRRAAGDLGGLITGVVTLELGADLADALGNNVGEGSSVTVVGIDTWRDRC